MGLISAITTLGGLIRPATDLTRVVRGDVHAKSEMDHEWRKAVLEQLGAEFAQPSIGTFDQIINGLNRVPRPALALGTLGLFVFAMADPIGFAGRMQGLSLVPDQMWWLLGAIVSFYFGARELHYFRDRRPKVGLEEVAAVQKARNALDDMRPDEPGSAGASFLGRRQTRKQAQDVTDPHYNAALEDWRAAQISDL